MNLNFYNGDSILDIIVKRIKENFPDFPIVLATTTNTLDDALVDRVKKYNIKIFRGSEENVLGRFLGASDFFGLKKVIRVCADNPFLDIESLEQLINEFEKSHSDYVSFCTNEGLPTIKTHYGFWAEAVSVEALRKVAVETANKYYLEHVTNYIYEHPENFKIKFLTIQDYLNKVNIRLTIDTETDFNIAKSVYEQIVEDGEVSIKNVFDKVTSRQDWLNTMSTQISKQTK